jgi:hypothetical protein
MVPAFCLSLGEEIARRPRREMKRLGPNVQADLEAVGDAVRMVDEKGRDIGVAQIGDSHLTQAEPAREMRTIEAESLMATCGLPAYRPLRSTTDDQKSTMVARCASHRPLSFVSKMAREDNPLVRGRRRCGRYSE